jgi:hypothetical protein
MQYEFEGCDNKRCHNNKVSKKRGEGGVCRYIIEFPMGNAPKVGESLPCPCCGKGKITRVFSSGVGAIVRGTATVTTGGLGTTAERFEVRGPDGNDMKITMIDNPTSDPEYHQACAIAAKQSGVTGISGMYYNKKYKKYCVDVESGTQDPFGTMKRYAGAAKKEKRKINIGTPTKRVTSRSRGDHGGAKGMRVGLPQGPSRR